MSIPEGVEIKVSGNPSPCTKHRKGAVFGPLFSSRRYIMHNSSLPNILRGLLERVFKLRKADGSLEDPPTPTKEFNQRLLSERTYLLNFPKLKPLTTKSVLSLWKGSKLGIYERAYDSLRLNPLTRKDGFLKTFVKCEKIDGSKTDPVPRVIQPRSPRYNLELAAYLKPNEHEFYKRIDQMYDTDGLGDKTIFKGVNATQAAKHLIIKASRYSQPVFVGLDASRFDQHVSEVALQWEHEIYKDSFVYGVKKLSKLLSWQIDNIGQAYVGNTRVRYRVRGRRMSGDMNTSLGNCLLMSSLVHAYMRSKQVPKFSLANNGDDCVLIFERKHLHLISDLSTWFHEMGFNMKIEKPVYDIREVEFCQVKVLTSPGYNICVRNPETVMSKDLHSVHPFTHQHQYLQWLIASGDCGRNSHYGIPILERFYSAFPKGEITDESIKAEYNRWVEYSIAGGSEMKEISDEMRHSFWVAYGMVPDAQIELENMLANVKFGVNAGAVNAIPYATYYQHKI